MTITDWIRPWYPGHIPVHGAGGGCFEGHIFPDCEDLLRVRTDVIEGTGWLDPHQGDVCEACLLRHDPDLYAEMFGDDDEDDE